MKKIFKIAAYDFRRLMLNPITLIIMSIALVGILILGVTYKIPTSPAYTASTNGETTKEIYRNFIDSSSANVDTKSSLQYEIEEAKQLITIQKSCSDYQTLTLINNAFSAIRIEIEKYKKIPQNSKYIQTGNIEEIEIASQDLKDFVTRFKTLKSFQSTLLITNKNFAKLESISNFFDETLAKNVNLSEKLDIFAKNLQQFNTLYNIVDETHTWNANPETLIFLENNYIKKAENKLAKIEAEISNTNNIASTQDTTLVTDIINLITNFKLTCESAKEGVEKELSLLLNNLTRSDNHITSFGDLHSYQTINQEETKLAITKINFFLDDESLYYTAYQEPLNFNIASYQISVYDNTYFLMSIVGFFTILFGIFAAYKLFGRDRKTGQMDVILSQDVTFGQVFAAKFLAIVISTLYVLGVFLIFTFIWSLLFNPTLSNGILAVFNLSSPYTISPFLFLLIKILGIELQVIFWSVITIFLMNLSRKFEVLFGVAVALFAVVTICNIFLNASLVYCLFPFIHADLTCMLGGGKVNAGFLQTPIYAYGNFFISLVYYVVVVGLLYNFTKQLFKKN